MEPPCGVEPQTWALRMPCSTSWATVARMVLLSNPMAWLKALIAGVISAAAPNKGRPPRGRSLTHYCVYDPKSSNNFAQSPYRSNTTPSRPYRMLWPDWFWKGLSDRKIIPAASYPHFCCGPLDEVSWNAFGRFAIFQTIPWCAAVFIAFI